MIAHSTTDRADMLTDQLYPWTLADLLQDRYAVYRVLTPILRRIDAQAQIAVCAKDMHPAAREAIHAVRSDIARTLEIRRRHALLTASSPQPPESPRNDDPQPEASDAEIALRMLQGLIQLAQQGRQDDRPDGGTKVRRPTPPTSPTPPSGKADPIF